MLSYTFYAKGHPNLKGDHKTTLEFTKDNFLTVEGNCIIGIDSDFDSTILSELLKKSKKFRMIISSDKFEDSLTFYPNNAFVSNHEMVIRKTEFLSERTMGIGASKASIDLSRELIGNLNNKDRKIKITIEPVEIKAILFDFDDTLVSWDKISRYKHKVMLSYVKNVLKIDIEQFEKAYKKAKESFGLPFCKFPSNYSRKNWYTKTFEIMRINVDEKHILEMERRYWTAARDKMKFFPKVPEVLSILRQHGFKIGIVTDSDGSPLWKEMRMKKVRLEKYIDSVVISDETGKNKPDPSNFILCAAKLNVSPEECFMIGDKPMTDLISSKALGMTTIHFQKGYYKDSPKETFIDFQASGMPRVLKIIEGFRK